MGPLGEPLDLESLPSPGTVRWVIRRKAEVVAAVDGGLLSIDEVCQRYNLTLEEFAGWQRAVDRSGMPGLRVTRSQFYRARHEPTDEDCGQTDPSLDPGPGPEPFGPIPVDPDRRNASRFALFLRTAKLMIDGSEQFCIIRDASSTGLQVKLFAPLPRHDQLAVELANGDRYAVRCVWTRGQSAGLRFLQPVVFERLLNHALNAGRRRHLRLRIALDGVLHLGETASLITFHDISQHGAAFKTDRWLLVDELVKIETATLPVLYAKVRWRNHPHYGVVFEQTFQLHDLARRFAQARTLTHEDDLAQARRAAETKPRIAKGPGGNGCAV
jgi:hypothetical protein